MKRLIIMGMFTISMQAHAALNCQAPLDALKTDIGSCNFGDQTACDIVCEKLAPRALPGTSLPSCSSADIQVARQEGRQEVLRDLSVTAIRQDFAYGIDEADCTSRVRLGVNSLRERAIQECNNKATSIHNCQVVGEARINTSAATIPRIKGNGELELKKKTSDEPTCRAGALERAKNEALNNCKIKVGYDCTLSPDSTAIVTHKIENAILGIGSDKRRCKAEIVAIPPANVRVQCTAEIKAINTVGGVL
ncbi:MAG: hypothetical protein AAB250_04495 [Bdellovibrionota bacterium]